EALPLQVAVATLGQREHARKRLTQCVVGAQAVDQRATAIAQRGVLGAEPLGLRDTLPPLALLRQQQRSDSAPSSKSERSRGRRSVEGEPWCELVAQRLAGEARRVTQQRRELG